MSQRKECMICFTHPSILLQSRYAFMKSKRSPSPLYNTKYGDHDPDGLLYVLAKDSARIQQKARENYALDPPQPYEEVRPLVIRANMGDEVRIRFRNRLNRRASIHVQGLRYNVLSSDGANVGLNPIPPRLILPIHLVCRARGSLSVFRPGRSQKRRGGDQYPRPIWRHHCGSAGIGVVRSRDR